nr:uncharacterized protein LOC109176566 [Ipomoea batatas]
MLSFSLSSHLFRWIMKWVTGMESSNLYDQPQMPLLRLVLATQPENLRKSQPSDGLGSSIASLALGKYSQPTPPFGHEPLPLSSTSSGGDGTSSGEVPLLFPSVRRVLIQSSDLVSRVEVYGWCEKEMKNEQEQWGFDAIDLGTWNLEEEKTLLELELDTVRQSLIVSHGVAKHGSSGSQFSIFSRSSGVATAVAHRCSTAVARRLEYRGYNPGNGQNRHGGYNFKNKNYHRKGESSGAKYDKDKRENYPKRTESVCYRCGMTGHWERVCHTSKHFVDLYQASLKGKANIESNNVFMEDDFVDTQLDVEDYLGPVENLN